MQTRKEETQEKRKNAKNKNKINYVRLKRGNFLTTKTVEERQS